MWQPNAGADVIVGPAFGCLTDDQNQIKPVISNGPLLRLAPPGFPPLAWPPHRRGRHLPR
jgi:hypothetical protein